jgi:hypothetical protein
MSIHVFYLGLVIGAFAVFMIALLFLQISDSRYRKQLALKAGVLTKNS